MAAQLRIQAKLTELLDCLSNVDKLINCHVANFFTKNLWTTVLPSDVLEDLENLKSFGEFTSQYTSFLRDGTGDWVQKSPHLHKFLYESTMMSIRKDGSCLTSLSMLQNDIMKEGHTKNNFQLKGFMSEKKRHEVVRMVSLTKTLLNLTGTNYVIDIGGGKGYLSCSLAHHTDLNLLTLDSSENTTCGAAKLEKMMVKKGSIQLKGTCERDTVLVSPSTDLATLLEKHFGKGSGGSGLLGLHTCGNLATSCCKLFVNQSVRWLINVGCCYHLIDEEFDKNDFWSDLEVAPENGFPVSDFLTKKKIRLGRNARMLAAHSLDKLTLTGLNQESMKSLFYRALLQVVVERVRGHDLMEGQVGRLFSKCASFEQYIQKAVKKLKLDIELSEKEINDLMSRYQDQEEKLKVFFILRTHFAPIIESVILLDRLLFLLEQGIPNAHLVPLFDPTLSPRNHAIVAWTSDGNDLGN